MKMLHGVYSQVVGTIKQIFGDNMRNRRKKLHLTQGKLAEMMNVALLTIQNWENCRRWPQAENVMSLAEHLQCHPSDLFMDPERDIVDYSKFPSRDVARLLAEEMLRADRLQSELTLIKSQNKA